MFAFVLINLNFLKCSENTSPKYIPLVNLIAHSFRHLFELVPQTIIFHLRLKPSALLKTLVHEELHELRA